jgi:hypothetical protein
MYDEYLLSNLFAKAGFHNIEKLSAKRSRITKWALTKLDCDSQAHPDCAASLFMEGAKSTDEES